MPSSALNCAPRLGGPRAPAGPCAGLAPDRFSRKCASRRSGGQGAAEPRRAGERGARGELRGFSPLTSSLTHAALATSSPSHRDEASLYRMGGGAQRLCPLHPPSLGDGFRTKLARGLSLRLSLRGRALCAKGVGMWLFLAEVYYYWVEERGGGVCRADKMRSPPRKCVCAGGGCTQFVRDRGREG